MIPVVIGMCRLLSIEAQADDVICRSGFGILLLATTINRIAKNNPMDATLGMRHPGGAFFPNGAKSPGLESHNSLILQYTKTGMLLDMI